jgi:hypothetical protein
MAASLPGAGHAKKNSRDPASVDPNHAEEILSRIPPRDPMQDTDWLKLLGGREAQSYTVQSGDTLWTIAHKVIGNPHLWRKLWEENPYLTNPHQLEVGQVLTYYKEPTVSRALASETIPIVKLSPLLGDLDSMHFQNVAVKNRFRPSFFVLDEKQPALGEITGAFISSVGITVLDKVYVEMKNPGGVKIGDRFSVVHLEKEIHDKSLADTASMGTLVRLVGELTITELGQKHVVGNLDSTMTSVKRGDKLIPLQPAVETNKFELPPNDLQARIVMGDEPDRKFFVAGQMVLLNKGTTDGMKQGYNFRVFREEDPNTKSVEGVEPDYSGEVQVVYVSSLSSVGYILRSVEPLKIGDTLIPRQGFQDPPPPPKKVLQTILID